MGQEPGPSQLGKYEGATRVSPFKFPSPSCPYNPPSETFNPCTFLNGTWHLSASALLCAMGQTHPFSLCRRLPQVIFRWY